MSLQLAAPEGYYSEAEMVRFAGYKNPQSFRTALSKGVIPLSFAILGNQKLFRRSDVEAFIESRMTRKTSPSPSTFEQVKRGLRSLKTECPEHSAKSRTLKGVG